MFPCFNEAKFRHFKELTHPAPCSETFDPKSRKEKKKTRPTQSCNSPLRVRWLLNLSPSENSYKQNKHSVFTRSGSSLMERILLSKQQGVCREDCGKHVFQQQEISEASFLLEQGCSRLARCLCRRVGNYAYEMPHIVWIQ